MGYAVISQLFDTRYRDGDYRREGGRRNSDRATAIARAARVTKRNRTWEKCPKRSVEGRREKGEKGAPRAKGRRERCARKVIRRNGAKESVLGRAVTVDETREKERTRVGIKWGGLLISLAIHPWSVAQDYPRVLPRLIQHYEYFLLVVGVTPAA